MAFRSFPGAWVAVAACAVAASATVRADWFVDGPSLPGDACEPYVLVEALAMQRAPGGGGPFVFNNDTQLPVIGSETLQFAMAPGVRALYGRHGPCALGWEVGYVGIYGMYADDTATGSDNLDIAPELSNEVLGMQNASTGFAKYTSGFESAEANLLYTQQAFKGPRVSAYAHDDSTRVVTWDWLAGFRWAGLTEGAAITMTRTGGLPDTYATRTSNNFYGGQIGFRGRADWGLWALDGWLKAALAAADVAQSQAPIVDTVTSDVFRPGGAASTVGLGGIFDIDIAVSRRIAETWAIRVGWNSIWLTGAALATNQFDFSNSPLPRATVATGGLFWVNGITLGLEGRW